MDSRIFELIRPWAAIPTWYTSHPLDQKRFSKAMHALISELGPDLNMDDFEKALRQHAETNPAVLGNPEHWDDIIESYLLKAETISTYEQERHL